MSGPNKNFNNFQDNFKTNGSIFPPAGGFHSPKYNNYSEKRSAAYDSSAPTRSNKRSDTDQEISLPEISIKAKSPIRSPLRSPQKLELKNMLQKEKCPSFSLKQSIFGKNRTTKAQQYNQQATKLTLKKSQNADRLNLENT